MRRLLVAALLLVASPAAAQTLETELREWIASTRTGFQFGVFEGSKYGDVRYRDATAFATEGRATLDYRHFLGSLTLGGGPIDGGVAIHRTANTVPEGQEPTRSVERNGSLLYARAEVGYRLLDARLRLDVLAGARYWAEHQTVYGAQGNALGILTRSDTPIPSHVRAAELDATWWGPTLATRGRYRLTRDLFVNAELTAMPWTAFEVRESWPQRSDLMTRSIRGEAYGGWGGDGRLGLEYILGHGWAVTLGLEYQYLHSGTSGHNGQGPGGLRFNPQTPDCRQPRCQPVRFEVRGTQESWGPWLGLSYRW